VLVSKGPGLLNAVGGVASAMHDPAALMVFTGAGSTHVMGKGGMQELYYNGFEDAVSVFRPVTKGSWILWRPETVIDTLNQAYKTAITGKPGPVFIQLPFDIQLAQVEGTPEPPTRRLVSARPRADAAAIERSAELLRGAERPVIVAGGGTRLSPGSPALLKNLAEATQVPVATTLTAKGVFPESHELSLGVVGRSGTDSAASATRNADVIVAVGARFSDNHTAMWRSGLVYDLPKTKIIHVNVDASEIGRNFPAEVGAVADAGSFLEDLSAALGPDGVAPHQEWLAQVAGWKRTWTEKIQDVITAQTSPIHPARLVYETSEAVAERARRGRGRPVTAGRRAHRGRRLQHGQRRPRHRGGVPAAGGLGGAQQPRARHRAQGFHQGLRARAPVGALRPQGHGRALQCRLPPARRGERRQGSTGREGR
jgi:acetolactate synthase-1/2/3 large subunit